MQSESQCEDDDNDDDATRSFCAVFAVSEKERVVNLGELIGKLPAGAGSLTGLKDDRRNKVAPGTWNPEIMNRYCLPFNEYVFYVFKNLYCF